MPSPARVIVPVPKLWKLSSHLNVSLFLPADFCLPVAIGRCAMRVNVRGIERDLDGFSRLFNAQFEDGLTV